MLDVNEIIFKKWQQAKLAHFYILKASSNEADPKATLSEFINKFLAKVLKEEKGLVQIDDAYKTIELGHSDILIIKQDKKNITKEYSVNDESFKEFFKFQNYNNFELKNRFIIVHDMHLIGKTLSNKLLKTLEEPSKNTTIFFLAPSSIKPISTISSRAITLNVSAKTEMDEIESFKSFPDFFNDYWCKKSNNEYPETFASTLKSLNSDANLLHQLVESLKTDKSLAQDFCQAIIKFHMTQDNGYEKKSAILKSLEWFKTAQTFNNAPSQRLSDLIMSTL